MGSTIPAQKPLRIKQFGDVPNTCRVARELLRVWCPNGAQQSMTPNSQGPSIERSGMV